VSGFGVGTFNHDIIFNHGELACHVHIGKCRAHHLTIHAHTLTSRWQARERQVVLAVFGKISIHTIPVVLILVFLDKSFDDRHASFLFGATIN
jgi:hypothetical protein